MSTSNERNDRMLARTISADSRATARRSSSRPRSVARGRRQRVRHAREVLHHAVVQVARDLAAFDVGRFERLAQQRFALLRALPQPAGERPRQRDLHELQCDQRAERDRGEAAPELVARVARPAS